MCSLFLDDFSLKYCLSDGCDLATLCTAPLARVCFDAEDFFSCFVMIRYSQAGGGDIECTDCFPCLKTAGLHKARLEDHFVFNSEIPTWK